MALKQRRMTSGEWISTLSSGELTGVAEILARGLRRNETLEDWARAILQQAIADGLVQSGAP